MRGWEVRMGMRICEGLDGWREGRLGGACMYIYCIGDTHWRLSFTTRRLQIGIRELYVARDTWEMQDQEEDQMQGKADGERREQREQTAKSSEKIPHRKIKGPRRAFIVGAAHES
jgi:hypothetical protein